MPNVKEILYRLQVPNELNNFSYRLFAIFAFNFHTICKICPLSRIAKKAIKPFKYLHTPTKAQTNKYPHFRPHTQTPLHTHTWTRADILHARMQINAKHFLEWGRETVWMFCRLLFQVSRLDLISRCACGKVFHHMPHCVYLIDFSSVPSQKFNSCISCALFVFVFGVCFVL